VYKRFGGGRALLGGVRPTIHAVTDVSIEIPTGRTMGVVGESGCGKSTLARMLVGLDSPSRGEIIFKGESLTTRLKNDKKSFRRKVQFVFQDSLSSLNPRKTVRQILETPLKNLLGMTADDRRRRVADLMELVNLRPEFLERYPHEFSGGQAQRIGIARALAAEAELLVLDEPVSALDVSVQAQILNLLRELKKELNLTFVFISHDLAVVENLCDTVAVMYLGRLVELADRTSLFAGPRHPYTRLLLASIPVPGKRAAAVNLHGELPNPADPPPGCPFESRCPQAVQKCLQNPPPLRFEPDGRGVACYRPNK
jgi:peptide/nickel transport system ATP-binding protein